MLPARLREAFAAQIRRMQFFSYPDVSFHSEGYHNAVFRVRSRGKDYAVRFSKSPALKKTVFVQYDYEKKVWGRVAALKISPRVFKAGRVSIAGKVFPYSVQEFVAGRPLDQSRDLRLLAGSLRRLHEGTAGTGRGLHSTGDALDWIARQLDYYGERQYSKVPAAARKILRKAANSAYGPLVGRQSCRPCLVHNDLVAGNVVIAARRAAFVDWGWAMHSSPAIDLCCALSPFVTSWKKPFFVPDPAATGFIKVYSSGMSSGEKYALASDVLRLWDSYSAMVACWILCDYAPHARS
ncbi:MAG: aminoglycoside phosphotransferase family protein, partial [Candidatus Micrarchaeota archaeon]